LSLMKRARISTSNIHRDKKGTSKIARSVSVFRN